MSTIGSDKKLVEEEAVRAGHQLGKWEVDPDQLVWIVACGCTAFANVSEHQEPSLNGLQEPCPLAG